MLLLMQQDKVMPQVALRQIFYRSQAIGQPDVGQILTASQRNNGIDGITGLLHFGGKVFLQILEGPDDSIVATMARICSDTRHEDVTVLSDRVIEDREFPFWSMELREPRNVSDEATLRLQSKLKRFAPDLRHHFFDNASN
jgi:hypothetical protein